MAALVLCNFSAYYIYNVT